MINIDDTFSKVDTYKLDNKMGISEGVHNLFLLDLTLKDRDKFLITFSGIFFLMCRIHLCEEGRVEGERKSGELLQLCGELDESVGIQGETVLV